MEATMAISRFILACIVLLWTAFPLSAQWVHYPTPGIPRTPDGKPNLSAPAPRTADGKPDLSGIWRGSEGNGRLFQDLGAGGVEIPMQPWAKRFTRSGRRTRKAIHPSVVSGTAWL